MGLNFKTFGSGDPVVILHGLFGMLDNWQSFAKKLAEDYMVFLVDQRNHGKSFHSDEFNYALLAQDLKEFMNEEWIHNASIIGHSMGGKTAMKLAMEYPELLSKLVVVDMSPKRYQGGHQYVFDALFAVPIQEIKARKEVQAILEQYLSESSTIQFLMKNLTRNKEGNYNWKMNLTGIHSNYQNILNELEGETSEIPTLFIGGSNSNYIDPTNHSEIDKLFPNSKLTMMEAGHWIHAEKPKELLSLILDFLKE